jgi:hypothetical protein
MAPQARKNTKAAGETVKMNTKVVIVCDHTSNMNSPQLYLEGGVECA